MDQKLVLEKIEAADLMYNIRKFDENEGLTRADGIYESRGGFNLVIIKKCILDFAQLLHAIDQCGYSKEKLPKEIIADLAESALEQNPQFRESWISGPGKVKRSDFSGTSTKLAENAKNAKIAKERNEQIRDLERKTLENAKKTILRILEEFSDIEIAEKLDILEVGVEVLKNRNWTFRDCLSIAEKLDLDVEIIFGRFRESREGKEKE